MFGILKAFLDIIAFSYVEIPQFIVGFPWSFFRSYGYIYGFQCLRFREGAMRVVWECWRFYDGYMTISMGLWGSMQVLFGYMKVWLGAIVALLSSIRVVWGFQ